MIRFGPILLVALFPLTVRGQDEKNSTFTSKDGRFSVALPGKPKEDTKKMKIGDREVDHFLFTFGQKDGARLVTYLDYPADAVGKDRKKFLAERVDGNVSVLKGKVVSDDEIAVGKQKHPGREVVVEMPDRKRTYRARVVLAGQRLYQVVALGPDDFMKSKSVDEYFKSFAIDE
jgi:hypothetical protein